jgi:hypothetical protein
MGLGIATEGLSSREARKGVCVEGGGLSRKGVRREYGTRLLDGPS